MKKDLAKIKWKKVKKRSFLPKCFKSDENFSVRGRRKTFSRTGSSLTKLYLVSVSE